MRSQHFCVRLANRKIRARWIFRLLKISAADSHLSFLYRSCYFYANKIAVRCQQTAPFILLRFYQESFPYPKHYFYALGYRYQKINDSLWRTVYRIENALRLERAIYPRHFRRKPQCRLFVHHGGE